VTDAPYTSDLNPASVTTHKELAALLKQVHLRADKPSLRRLAASTRHDSTPLSKTAVSNMLRGVRPPRKTVMVAFLRACGVPDDQLEPWRRAWDRISSSESTLTETGEDARLRQEINRLREENDRLRLELAEIDRRSIWRFPDNSRITLVSYRVPPDLRPRRADPADPNYDRLSGLADLDTLIDIYGEISKYNPASEAVIMAAQDLTWREVKSHLVLIGGLTWKTVIPWFSQDFPIPIEAGDPFERGAIVVRNPDGGEHEFRYRLVGDGRAEDVGFFARGKNPDEPLLTLTICGGVTTRGVHGAAKCFVDLEMRDRNEEYLKHRFPDGSTYCIVMRVQVVHQDVRVPDLSKDDDRFFEWCDPGEATH
jgi:transposase-like protein